MLLTLKTLAIKQERRTKVRFKSIFDYDTVILTKLCHYSIFNWAKTPFFICGAGKMILLFDLFLEKYEEWAEKYHA